MANRYWVGGTASWDGTAGTKWSDTSNGSGGFSVPTNADDVFFDGASGAVIVTIAAGASCRNLTCTGYTGSLVGGGGSTLEIAGNCTLVSGMTWNNSGSVTFSGASGASPFLIDGGGKTFNSVFIASGASAFTWSLQSPFTVASSLTVRGGTFNTNNFALTASDITSSNSNTRTINFGSSTVTLTGISPFNFSTSTGLTFNAGTSQVNCSNANTTIDTNGAGGLYNLSLTSTGIATAIISVGGSYNNIAITGRTLAGVANIRIESNITVNGTLTISAGADATCRTFLQSGFAGSIVIGSTRTLTCASVSSLTDVDFRDIIIAGAAVSGGPLSGTRLGDCKGNGGISFGLGVTRYWNLAGGGNWSGTGWAATSGGSPAVNNFPLAQDTVIFEATGLNSGATVTINSSYNIGTINMSARTSNTMTLAMGFAVYPQIYGNWINGTGTTLSGNSSYTFAGRGSQTITSAGIEFVPWIEINTPGGSITLLDNFVCSASYSLALQLYSGTFNLNGYTATFSGASSGFRADVSISTRQLAIGTGTLIIAGSSGFQALGSNFTVTGTGTISLTSASSKPFEGGGIQTYPTLNQGGAGTLTISDSNKFANITNTYAATGATNVLFTGGTTNEFDAFNLTGQAGRVCSLASTSLTQATLRKPSPWLMGANSTNGGNNTGLTFAAGGGIDYLSVSYINGINTAPSGNFLMFF